MSTVEFGKTLSFKDSIEYAEGSIVSKKIVTNKGGNVSLFGFDKGQALSEHTAPFDALVQILEGVMKISLDNVDHLVAEGQSIIMPANVPHALEALQQSKMLLTMIKD